MLSEYGYDERFHVNRDYRGHYDNEHLGSDCFFRAVHFFAYNP